MISFFLNNTCNLNCIYCYTNKSKIDRQVLDFNFAKAWIDDFFNKYDSRRIRFFWSWEPTLEFNLMKKIKEYACLKTENKKIKAEIQTNWVFSEKIAHWLAKNIDIIWVSCDGIPEFQDYYRPLLNWKWASKMIEKNIKYMIKNSDGMVWARVTIWSKNLYYQKEIIEYFYSLWIKNIWSDPIFPGVSWDTQNESINFLTYAKEFLKVQKIAEKLGVFYGSIYTCNFDWESNVNCRANIPMPHLTSDWYVSACDMAMFWKNSWKMLPFIYGKWDKNSNEIIYDKKKIKFLQSRTVENMPWCKNCSVKTNCWWYCLWEVLNETWDLFWKKVEACNAINYLWQKMNRNFWNYKYPHP